MSKNIIRWILIIGGLLIFLLSLAADVVGIGTYPGINYAQLGAMAVGLIFVIYGILMNRKKKS
ncbi:MAG TPA: hypothetical protein PLV27_01535 [Anaerolineaceae bacterium]|nr:hypothetical protein [Anaerolineaceae bacterium]